MAYHGDWTSMSYAALSPIVTPTFSPSIFGGFAIGAFVNNSFVLDFHFISNRFTSETTANGGSTTVENYAPRWPNFNGSSAPDTVYEVMCTVVSGPALNSGVATGVWWPLVFILGRRFGQSRSKAVDGVGTWSNTLRFDIRSATTGFILASTEATINGTIF